MEDSLSPLAFQSRGGKSSAYKNQAAMENAKNPASLDSSIHAADEAPSDISDLRIYDIPVLIIFALLFFIVALQFFTRYVLNDSLGWTEEIARYFLILLGFVGGINCVRKTKHIFLEFAYHYLPKKTIKPIVLFVDMASLFFWGYAAYLAIELARRTNADMVSVAISKDYLYYSVSAACFLMALFAGINMLTQFKKSAAELMQERLQQAQERP